MSLRNSPPRLRMFAGPNGSGKSTIKAKIESINRDWLGINVNPDEIEAEIRSTGVLSFHDFGIKISPEKLRKFLLESTLLKKAGLHKKTTKLSFGGNRVAFGDVSVNAYFASVLADLIRQNLAVARRSFSFETVMSSPDKVHFLQKSRRLGYRNYLYFIATEDPIINISRVAHRVKTGGHDVPKEKIETRYYRSLGLLLDTIKLTDRAYIFDNSGSEAKLIAEIDDMKIEIQSDSIPSWFKKHVLDKVEKQQRP